jgi:hypothetical protein
MTATMTAPDATATVALSFEEIRAEYERKLQAWKEGGEVGDPPPRPVKPHTPGMDLELSTDMPSSATAEHVQRIDSFPEFKPATRGMVHKMEPKDNVEARIGDVKDVAAYAQRVAASAIAISKKEMQLQLASCTQEWANQLTSQRRVHQGGLETMSIGVGQRFDTLTLTMRDAIKEAIETYDAERRRNVWWRRALRVIGIGRNA